jgi:hypothetical protein
MSQKNPQAVVLTPKHREIIEAYEALTAAGKVAIDAALQALPKAVR